MSDIVNQILIERIEKPHLTEKNGDLEEIKFLKSSIEKKLFELFN
jgi:hypothetical protein